MIQRVPTLPLSGFELPTPLQGLARLATNLRWAWDTSSLVLFTELDPSLAAAGHGPVAILRATNAAEGMAGDAAFVARVKDRTEALESYLAAPPSPEGPIAYFCAEFGLHETFPLYSGGLGILAGDHLKEASDLNLPMVAVGLFYRRGFFHQMVDSEGRQEHRFPNVDPDAMPVERVLQPGSNEPLTVSVELPGRTVQVAVWRAAVGRIALLLLDTDVDGNAAEDRKITSQLYTSGRDMRLHQETVLGVGGVRVLAALGIAPSVWHMNEGHSALLLVERLRALTASGSTLESAVAEVKAGAILTIHTPVAAGNERFSADHVEKVLAPLIEGSALKMAWLLQRGLDSEKTAGTFDMTAFALRLSRLQNGVSLLHGKTADKTWRKVAGQPVIGLTNGVHMPTWLGPEVRGVLEHAGAGFAEATALPDLAGSEWSAANSLDDRALWEAHLAQKRRMVAFARRRIFEQRARHGAGPSELAEILAQMDEDALILGFARRFATYKRAHLIFSDRRRLRRLLRDAKRPVQIVFAGKAHPADRAGQALIAKVFAQTLAADTRGKVFFLEEYDMEVGRMLVQGVDVWLNNPRRPLEASGTSGMKAAANGVPNASVLDGWWDEGYVDGPHCNGWAIGGRKTVADEKLQDKADAEALYRVLEEQIAPTYFERDADGLPRAWTSIMKRAIATSVWQFSTARMLTEYDARMYRP